MFKDNRYINAGQNEIHRYGHKAVDKVKAFMIPNEAGFISIPADGGKYWSLGTSNGKFGEFARFGETCFSVNKAGYIWAKAGTEKGDHLIKALERMIEEMKNINMSRFTEEEKED